MSESCHNKLEITHSNFNPQKAMVLLIVISVEQ